MTLRAIALVVFLAAGISIAQEKQLSERQADPKVRRPVPIIILDDGVLYAESPFAGQTVEERQRAFRVLVEAIKTAIRELDEEGFFNRGTKPAPNEPARKP